MAYDLDFLLRVRAPRPVVFEKLLRIEHLARWFCGWCRIEPKVGGRFVFGGETCLVLPEGRGWETTIDQGETLRRFAFTWPIHGTSTRVSYELDDAEGGTTVLRARHSGVPTRESTCGRIDDAWRTVLGNLKSISEGRSDSVRPDHGPAAPPEVRLSCLIESTPERVFTAFTEARELERWIGGGVPSGDSAVEPYVGGVFSLGGDHAPGRILGLEAAQGLSLVVSRPSGDLHLDVNLEAKASGVVVYLASTGYTSHEATEVLHDRGMWSMLLVCLKNFVESGDAGFANAFGAQARGT